MSPRLSIWSACRALAVRTRPAVPPRIEPFRQIIPATRHYSDDAPGHPTKPIGADLPSKIKSPLTASKAEAASAEVVRNADSQLAKDASQVGEMAQDSHINTLDDATLEQILYGGRTVTSETEGGLTAAQEDALYREGTIPPPAEAEALLSRARSSESSQLPIAASNEIENPGHKFGLPRKPYPEGYNMKQRYHPVLEQITRLLMRDGKLSVAQRNMAMVMNFLRTAPAPIYSPKFPLLPGTPPASHLSLNPILYITIAVDSVAPLLKVRNVPGAGGGGRALELPVPLGVRQRRRMAFQWILDVINKKPSKGSGRKQFPHRIAEEIIAVVEGRSSVWEKRRQVHKLGTAARANVNSKKLKVKKRK
ncbi:37S ribosomal protein S7, mitochondrial [Tolypocladium paradoxum]|uniref:Small ribosomal subunit protein uS7m n=1 Tax=Tolypocladium paradoxum TaxID=94208 RepID=A0A2S4KY89_9HYPO|nr:37S ribosomal protein S7, mitochondrial [Tolypocladium paradoxum]